MSSSGILSLQIAKHYRDVHFGGNWTCVNLKAYLGLVSRDEALRQAGNRNTIAALACHIYYYVRVQLQVLEGGPLEGNDELSWITPDFPDEASWRAFLEASWAAVERAAVLIGNLPEEKLWEPFTEEKYGNYYRNLHGAIEHCHYHAGQIVLLYKEISRGSEVGKTI